MRVLSERRGVSPEEDDGTRASLGRRGDLRPKESSVILEIGLGIVGNDDVDPERSFGRVCGLLNFPSSSSGRTRSPSASRGSKGLVLSRGTS